MIMATELFCPTPPSLRLDVVAGSKIRLVIQDFIAASRINTDISDLISGSKIRLVIPDLIRYPGIKALNSNPSFCANNHGALQ